MTEAPAEPVPADRTGKQYYDGTHRVCSPERTLSRIEPVFPQVGITRLADVTGLDVIGIPVYQAIRPNAYSLSVSQGKGLTPALAQVSAAMESIELWHGERAGPGVPARVGDMAGALGYRVDDLPLAPRHHLNPALLLEWTPARRLTEDAGTASADGYVPTGFVRLDGRTGSTWAPRLFLPTSNGLASGNTTDEAVLHGLYEVIERDAEAHAQTARSRTMLDLGTVRGSAADLLDRFRSAGVQVSVQVLPSPFGLPCFRARICSDVFPTVFYGMGCHLDRDVSLCRALTEAAQSRLTSIAGSRDDMSGGAYRSADEVSRGRTGRPDLDAFAVGADWTAFSEVDSVRNHDLAEDLRLVAGRVRTRTGHAPLVVDHTRPELGVPVVHVVCPGLRHVLETN